MAKGSLAIQVLPMGTGSKQELYRAVDLAIEVIKESGVMFEVGPFETTMEGEIDILWAVAFKAHRAVKDSGIGSVLTYIKMSESDEPSSMEEKVAKHRA
ncbi:MAG: hypothetical protein BWY00_01675 [Firmicutes bacterium ADurb.Bin153]|nr:MAG: hypothetical protein BWY00_01675 [Firmicutes bacterium ADurb.Bin153]